MYYLIYKITNKINNKIYIGAHKTLNIDDGYMGSGSVLKSAKDKYGLESFHKDILFQLSDDTEMYNKEKEIVNEDFINRDNTYNIKLGGIGGCVSRSQDSIDKAVTTYNAKSDDEKNRIKDKRNNSLRGMIRTDEQRKKMSLSQKNISWDEKYGKEKSTILKQQASERLKGVSFFEGRTHSEESKEK